MVSSKKFGKNINIFDPTIGMGRLMYDSFIELKEKFPMSNINIFGIDLNSRFVVISESLLNLVNNQNVFIKEGNTLKGDFSLPQMDICISNPPYEKGIEYTFVEYIKNLNCKSFMILPSAFNSNKKAEKIKKELIDKNLLKTIIQLPSKLFKNTNIQTLIVELDNNPLKEIEELAINNKVLFERINYKKDVKSQIKEIEKNNKKEEDKKNPYKGMSLQEINNEYKRLLAKLAEGYGEFIPYE